MNLAQCGRVATILMLLTAVALAGNPSPVRASWIAPFWAQATETFKPRTNPLAKASGANPITSRLLRSGLLAIGTMFAIAGSYFGLFALLIRRKVWPLNAFAIASICATGTFFGLLLGLFWEELLLSSGNGVLNNSPRLIVIALMIATGLAIWNYHRGQARKIRAGL